ncbi:hypothetical protein NPX13_g1845 [Xylaria arbuscula]|uniref:Erythromycin biosynthesis protein CIII-like C-terminal domain-containing protein n=1 Tax=Xylaria arbuscula TaxID=114810 RepID=A0A9W8NKC2_9PEZI|nr:hypothetical protein NPX13_g1845 [Xylaria arbuscula]
MGRLYQIATVFTALVALTAVFLASRSNIPSEISFSPVQGRNGTALFFINTEYGLSNVHLATVSGLLEKYPCTEIHVASFPRTAKKLERLSSLSRRKSPETQVIQFHELPGPEYLKAVADRLGGREDSVQYLLHRPGMRGMKSVIEQVQVAISPWETKDHIRMFEKAGEIIRTVDPSVVVLDTTLRPPMQATWKSNRLYAYISPNALVDGWAVEQPYMSFLWKYPRMGSDFSVPIPWWKIPENIYVTAGFMYASLIRLNYRATLKQLNAYGIGNHTMIPRRDTPWISQYMPGASAPLDVIPPSITCAGPIVLDGVPAMDQDPELTTWVSRAPTVLINLGSLFTYPEDRAKTMALAVRSMLIETDVQVLWKMAKEGTYPDDYLGLLKDDIEQGRLRVTEWLGANPVSLLETGHIIASIHHGGANCYNEAIAAGVPQVIMPMWLDLYNYAQLVEDIGVGVYATRGTAPDWTLDGLRDSFLKVVDGGEDSIRMREKAKELGKLAQEEPGRLIAAKEVARLARSACA